MSAWVNGILGTILVFAIALLRLNLNEFDAALCVIGSNVAGLGALLIYSFGVRQPWMRQYLLNGPLRTWLVFLTSWLGLLVALTPPLRSATNFAWLILPTIFTTGFCIVAFGPIQDYLVARAQRQSAG